MSLKSRLASAVAVGALTLGGTAAGVALVPTVAAASSVSWSYSVKGAPFSWHAVGLRNGYPCWEGPVRVLKSTASQDGADWRLHPYCP